MPEEDIYRRHARGAGSVVGTRSQRSVCGATISHLKSRWEDERKAWSEPDLPNKHYVYFWFDGVYFNVRMNEASQCILVIGVTKEGIIEFVAIEDGYRGSEQSLAYGVGRLEASKA